MTKRPRSLNRFLLSSLGALAVLVSVSTVHAQANMVAPSTRQMFATFGFGPSIGIDPSGTQFKIAQEFGYHFQGASGPAIGASLEEAFGSGLFRFQIGPKFWWDFQPSPTLGLYLAPHAKLGYGLLSATGWTGHAFNFQFGFEGRLVLGDRGMIFFRPLTIDLLFGDWGGQSVAAVYDLMFGGGVTF